jgi:hypothetical protein
MAPTDQWSSIIDKTIESKSYVAWYRNGHSLWFTGVSHGWPRDTSDGAIPSFRRVNHNCPELFDHSEFSKSSRTFGRVQITAFLADSFVGICGMVCTWYGVVRYARIQVFFDGPVDQGDIRPWRFGEISMICAEARYHHSEERSFKLRLSKQWAFTVTHIKSDKKIRHGSSRLESFRM